MPILAEIKTHNKMEQELSPEKLLEIIADNFLCVRRLPFETTSLWSYREGDEERVGKPIYLEGGKILNAKRTVFFHEGCGRKMVREVKVVEKGGWWYVKQVADTGSTVRFSREYDKFFAPTLLQAVRLFLESKK